MEAAGLIGYTQGMDASTVSVLLDLNKQFYQTFAASFSATRQRIQPGVRRLLDEFPRRARFLDLGCGNGELAHVLAAEGFCGEYIGMDVSRPLLETTTARSAEGLSVRFITGDLAASDWQANLPQNGLDVITAFAVLHHLPGRDLRLDVLRRIRLLLAPGGKFYHSQWQFLTSQRLRAHILPWDRLGLDETQVDEGDALLDWRAEKDGLQGMRYAHHFTPAELEDLAQAAGFRVLSTFTSDGKEGNLGLYSVWETK